ncbi:MAG: hypothetical protein ABIF10_01245 [Candidatus Woesearchaeota archaeon]
MKLVERAFFEMYGKPIDRPYSLEYGRLRSFNGRVALRFGSLYFLLSSKWKDVSEDIQVGLLQVLIGKISKRHVKTTNVDLYHNFIRNLSFTVAAKKVDPLLRESFERVNQKHFFGSMDCPNLCFGRPSSRTFGSYNFHTNTITISSLLKNDEELVDYIMYHELLHKKLKFTARNVRTTYHTKEFRTKEKSFENADMLEKRLHSLARKRGFVMNFFS